MTTYTVATDDPALAAKLFALAGSALSPAVPPNAPPAAPPVVAPPTLPVAAAPVMPPPAAPPVVAPPVAAAPPVTAPPATPAYDPALDVPPAGWTFDHVKSAAAAFTAKHGSGGAAKLAEICAKYCAPGTAKPSVSKVLKGYWASIYQELTA